MLLYTFQFDFIFLMCIVEERLEQNNWVVCLTIKNLKLEIETETGAGVSECSVIKTA